MTRSDWRRSACDLALIGLRGSGKSTVAARVAQHERRPFIDLDEQLAAQAGRTIAECFADWGEPEFRRRESEMLARTCQARGAVLGAGGGVILREENRRWLADHALCVWLCASVAELRRRLEADPRTAANRPSLTGNSPLDEIKNVAATREPLFAAVADWRLDTTTLTPDEAAAQVCAWLREND